MNALADALAALVRAQDVPGAAAAMFQQDRVIWTGAAGARRVGDGAGHGLAMTPDTKMRVASISKLVTALLVHVLAERGAIDLDGDCSPLLGFELRHPVRPDAIITPRMLLSHTSGVRDGNDDAYQGVIGVALADFFKAGSDHWHGGRHWAEDEVPVGYFCYSNLAMGLLAQMVERATHTRFDHLARNLVLDPIGSDAGFNWSGVAEDQVRNCATLYRCAPVSAGQKADWQAQMDAAPENQSRPIVHRRAGLSLDDYPIGSNGLVFSPQGGLRASVRDLARIGAALGGSVPLLSATTRANMLSPVWQLQEDGPDGDTDGGAFAAFGSGVHVLMPRHHSPIFGLKTPLVGHYGSAYGLLAGLWVEPRSGLGFVYVVNGTHAHLHQNPECGLTLVEQTLMQAAAR
ncbi:MAG: hypothetical protein RLZZ157_1460, partial [Pseudomonadota bacterium]